MKKSTLVITLILATVLTVNAQVLERWTYDGAPDFTLWVNLPSEITGSAFGTPTTYFVASLNNQLAFSSNEGFGLVNEGYFGGISNPSYASKTTGPYQISYDITSSDFTNTGAGSGRFGWGLRSTASGTDDCNLIFEYNNGDFNLIVTDATGTKAPVTIASGTSVANVRIRQLYDLDSKGSPGSFQVFYSIGGAIEAEILPGTLSLPSDFRVDEFRAEAQATSGGYTWRSGDETLVDNLVLESPSFDPQLSFIQESVSFITDNGVIPNTPALTYEPGDVLQIVTTNFNDSIVSVSDVSTTLWADPTAFSITPGTVNVPGSLAPGQTYLITNQVTILDGAVHGTNNVFTVTNRINSASPAPIAFESSF